MRTVLKTYITILFFVFTSTSIYSQKKAPNILIIAVDDLRQENNSIGTSFAITPNIDMLAKKGRAFNNHYVNAPSCGPSRYTLLTGRYGPSHNGALWSRSKHIAEENNDVPPSMPEWFHNNGYTTVSVGKVSHYPGGHGGDKWNDKSLVEMPNAWDRLLMPVKQWKTPRGAMHSLANGATKWSGGGMLHVFEAFEGPDETYHDAHIAKEALIQIEELTNNTSKPFFLAVGFIKPHLPFGAPKKYYDLYKDIELPPIAHPEKPKEPSSWHISREFMHYKRWGKDPRIDAEFANEVRRHYAACASYADAQIGKILKKLKETGEDKNTIIVLWGDHGWNLGEHNIWGKHNLFEEGLNSPLIIVSPEVKQPGKKTNAIVETSDIFPTLCDLTNVEIPNFVEGQSLLSNLRNNKATGHSAISYWKGMRALRNERYRFILHNDGQIELYDHNTPEKETKNIALENPKLIKVLKKELISKIPKIRSW